MSDSGLVGDELRERLARAVGAAKYRRKPVVIEAMLFNGFNGAEIARWGEGSITYTRAFPASSGTIWPAELKVRGVRGCLIAASGSWVIKEGNEFYPCTPDDFGAIYEPV